MLITPPYGNLIEPIIIRDDMNYSAHVEITRRFIILLICFGVHIFKINVLFELFKVRSSGRKGTVAEFVNCE